MHTTSYVAHTDGIPYLYINGIKQNGLAYITYLTEQNRYSDFANAGYRLFSVPVFFGYNHLNENSGLHVFTKGIFDTDTPDFSVFDADIEMILNACPDAYILPRVNVSVSRTWELVHPDELCDAYPDGTPGRASFASERWANDIKNHLAIFLSHISESAYASHIAGYQIAGGNTEEWLPLDKNGISGPCVQEAYLRHLREHAVKDSDAEFYRFYSALVADRICEFAAEVKKLTEYRLAVGSFYGYTLECPERTSGHHALQRVLECKDIDFICSPISYSMTRAIGRDHPYMIPFASIRHHGKLYFSENDTRTHLSRPVNDMAWYNGPIWFGPDRNASCEIIKLHAARACFNNHAAWWFDMWGGWFADPAYMELLQKIHTLFSQKHMLPCGSVTETAVFVDEKAYALLSDAAVSRPVCNLIREALGKMSVPYDIYLASDAESVIGRYKAVIALIPIDSPDNDHVQTLAQAKQIPLLAIRKDNADITSEALRTFLRQAGVHIWCNRDAVIYADKNSVFLHTTETAAYTLQFPECNTPLHDSFSGEAFVQGAVLPAGKSLWIRYRS